MVKDSVTLDAPITVYGYDVKVSGGTEVVLRGICMLYWVNDWLRLCTSANGK